MTTINPPVSVDLMPSPEGYANIAHTFANQILADVRKVRASSDREIMVQLLKISAHFITLERPDLLSRLLVAIEKDEPIVFDTRSLMTGEPT